MRTLERSQGTVGSWSRRATTPRLLDDLAMGRAAARTVLGLWELAARGDPGPCREAAVPAVLR